MHVEDGPDQIGEALRANLRTLAEIRADTQQLRADTTAVTTELAAMMTTLTQVHDRPQQTPFTAPGDATD